MAIKNIKKPSQKEITVKIKPDGKVDTDSLETEIKKGFPGYRDFTFEYRTGFAIMTARNDTTPADKVDMFILTLNIPKQEGR